MNVPNPAHRPFLVADIGGTNARFALATVSDGVPNLHQVEVLPCADYPTLEAAIESYLGNHDYTACDAACFAIAAPLTQRIVPFTNNHWVLNQDTLPAQQGFRQFKLVNDFTAMALGVTALSPDQCVSTNPGQDATWQPLLTQPRLVIGPGTGLGVSALVPLLDEASNPPPTIRGWIPLSTEGGHIAFAPTNEQEVEILRILWRTYDRVSVERLLCGEGLTNLYRAWHELAHREAPGGSAAENATRTPAEITSDALSDPTSLAHQVVQHFCQLLGQVVGDAALLTGARGGVYLCGGILPRILPLFQHSGFRTALENKARMQPFVQQIPSYVVTEPLTGLLGAALALHNAYT